MPKTKITHSLKYNNLIFENKDISKLLKDLKNYLNIYYSDNKDMIKEEYYRLSNKIEKIKRE